MKTLKLIDGTKKNLADDEAENVKKAIYTNKFVELRDGTLVNVSSISLLEDAPKKPYWSTYRVYSAGNDAQYIIRDGQKIFLDPKHIAEVQYKEEPMQQPIEDTNHLLGTSTAAPEIRNYLE